MAVTINTMALRLPERGPPASALPSTSRHYDSLCLLHPAKKQPPKKKKREREREKNSGLLEWDFTPCLEMCKALRARSGECRKRWGRGLGPRGQLQAADKGQSRPQQELSKQSRAQTGVRGRDGQKSGDQSEEEGVLQTALSHPHWHPPSRGLACCPDL